MSFWNRRNDGGGDGGNKGNQGYPQQDHRHRGGGHSSQRGATNDPNNDMDWQSGTYGDGSYGQQHYYGGSRSGHVSQPPQVGYMQPNYGGYGGHNQMYPHSHMQSQSQMFRSAQASKQMVYEVYGNVIGILEELESRELKSQKHQPLPRSDIYVPDQKHKKDKDIQRIVETQLLLFQNQLKSCPPDIRQDVEKELQQNTLQWKASRENIPQSKTDKYAGQLFEILAIGKSQHPDDFYKPPDIGENDIIPSFEAILHGEHKRSELDRDFRENPDRQAKAPNIRRGDVEKGAARMADTRPELRSYVNKHKTDGGGNL